MRIRHDSVFVSSVLLTICLLSLVPSNLKFAGTWNERIVWMTDRIARLNYESSIAFASLALIIIGITVIWTGYQKRSRWSWFIMAIFVSVYFVPVYVLDIFLDIRRVGWPWWPAVVREAMEGRQYPQGAIRAVVTLALMVIALLLPIRAFLGKKSFRPPVTNQQN